jgi:putative transposase
MGHRDELRRTIGGYEGQHFRRDVIVTVVRWYVAYPLSFQHVEELLEERGFEVDYTTVHRWLVRFSPLLLAQARRHQRKLGKSWRMDETYACARQVVLPLSRC